MIVNSVGLIFKNCDALKYIFCESGFIGRQIRSYYLKR